MTHKSGFVNILGKPNVGKSTLLNALLGEKLVITTSKPQTTRHRIFGIDNGEDYQIVYSDTPGIIEDPRYGMQEVMNSFALSVFEDADILLYMVDVFQETELHPLLRPRLGSLDVPVMLIINKIDLKSAEEVQEIISQWKSQMDFDEIFTISALEKLGTSELQAKVLKVLPEGPEYFPKDEMSDRPMRFFVSEMIREQILEQYKQEIPYACQVEVEEFKKETRPQGDLLRIRAIVYVERKSQKAILIGHRGENIKKLGTASRHRLEDFLQEKIYLELYVKVRQNWRDDKTKLSRFGYQ